MFYLIENNKIIGANYKVNNNYKETDIITYDEYKEHPNKVILQDGVLILNPNYEEEEEERRQEEFNKEFFNTTLGYVRRSVTMRDGSKKDFLSDLLPAISAGVQGGMEVRIILYNQPPFTQDVEDWTQYQHIETADAQFVSECMQQLQADFGVLNQGV